MKYTSLNELSTFQFHNALFNSIKIIDKTMYWEMSAIDIMTTNSQNNHTKDMTTDLAYIVFDDVVIHSLERTACDTYNSKNELIKSVKNIIIHESEYNKVFDNVNSQYSFTYGMEEFVQINDSQYKTCFNVYSAGENYHLTIFFSKVIVSWDEYTGDAWYEHPKWKK